MVASNNNLVLEWLQSQPLGKFIGLFPGSADCEVPAVEEDVAGVEL